MTHRHSNFEFKSTLDWLLKIKVKFKHDESEMRFKKSNYLKNLDSNILKKLICAGYEVEINLGYKSNGKDLGYMKLALTNGKLVEHQALGSNFCEDKHYLPSISTELAEKMARIPASFGEWRVGRTDFRAVSYLFNKPTRLSRLCGISVVS